MNLLTDLAIITFASVLLVVIAHRLPGWRR